MMITEIILRNINFKNSESNRQFSSKDLNLSFGRSKIRIPEMNLK